MKKILYIVSTIAVLAGTASCAKEQFDIVRYDNENLDEFGGVSSTGNIDIDPNKIVINLTVPAAEERVKSAGEEEVVYDATAEVVSFEKGKNPMMYSEVEAAYEGTKSIFDSRTTTTLHTNFLRLDQETGENGIPTGWPGWNKSRVLEADVTSNPDNTENIYYRNINFIPTQKYNILTFPVDAPQGSPRDTIFYHTRMVGFYPAICAVPRSHEVASSVYFDNPIYASNFAQISGGYGVVFKNALDGQTDVMMSNIADAQRWHNKTERTHYLDTAKENVDATYSMPFGHNDERPFYSNPFFYKHYLTAIRISAKVDQSGDGEQRALNLQSWGEIQSVSVLEQPSTVTIALPAEESSAFIMNADGTLYKDGDKLFVQKDNLKFGAPITWADESTINICGGRLFGDGDVNHEGVEEVVEYPIDMSKYGDMHSMEETYLGYILVRPCDLDANRGIILAIKTSGGIYRANISAIINEGKEDETAIFKEGQIYNITLNLRTVGTFTEFIENEDDSEYTNLSPYDELNETYQSSNCYIVNINDVRASFDAKKKAGYCFIASLMGNGPQGVLSSGNLTFPTTNAKIPNITGAKLIWESEPNLITNIQLQHSYIRFYVNKATVGNAVIGVTDASGKILWSWHIWITEQPNEVTVSGVKYMDRNLGATWGAGTITPSTSEQLLNSFGLYYQWGRKDPMPTPKELDTDVSSIRTVYDAYSEETTTLSKYQNGDGTIELSIEYPDLLMFTSNSPYYEYNWMYVPNDILWGKYEDGKLKKSIYDPCPFGYRVPYNEIQSLVASSTNEEDLIGGVGRGLIIGEQLYLPYAGFIGSERNVSATDAQFKYVGQKGDYLGAMICSPEEAEANKWFSNHRLRTYITKQTTWTEEYIDGGNFTFNAPNHYVVSTIDSHRDYTNRSTAGSVRCVRDNAYKVAAEATAIADRKYVENNDNVVLTLTGVVNGLATIGDARLIITPVGGDPLPSINVMDLPGVKIKGGKEIECTYTHNVGDLGEYGGYTYEFTIKDTENTISATSRCEVHVNYAKLLLFPDGDTGLNARRFVSVVDNLTGLNDPVLGQPTILTVYASPALAEKTRAEISSITGKYDAAGATRELTFTRNESIPDITRADGVVFHAYSAIWNSDDYNKWTSANTQDISVTLILSNDASSVAKGSIKVWELTYTAPGEYDNLVVINDATHLYMIYNKKHGRVLTSPRTYNAEDEKYTYVAGNAYADITLANKTYYSLVRFDAPINWSRTTETDTFVSEHIINHAHTATDGGNVTKYYLHEADLKVYLSKTPSPHTWHVAFAQTGIGWPVDTRRREGLRIYRNTNKNGEVSWASTDRLCDYMDNGLLFRDAGTADGQYWEIYPVTGVKYGTTTRTLYQN